MRVIGTAGHVDHGKSTLIAALTGIHPDRLKEEQEREMTIDLGFGWLTLPQSKEEIGIVDVPGHRDFIENMLAGVGGIDAVLLVIAADEGVMPQTREHLAIIDLLQIPAGLIVLNKIDLIEDEEWLDLVEEEIRQTVQGTVLAQAPIVRVSARRGAGLEALLIALENLLQAKPPRSDLGRPRLNVDRVFSLSGFGTIVTGTLMDGRFRIGDEIVILPSARRGRIRSLQTHKKKEETAYPGSRTAINISGLSAHEIRRGDVVTLPEQYRSARRVDAHLRLLPDAPTALKHNTFIKFFIGASERLARVRVLGTEAIKPGQEGWIQVEFEDPIVTVRGDRFIIRRPSPPATLGGGLILNPQAAQRYKRFDADRLKKLETLLKGAPSDLLLQASETSGPARFRDLVEKAHLDWDTALGAFSSLLQNKRIIYLGEAQSPRPKDYLVAASQWQRLRSDLLHLLRQYHAERPLSRGIAREEAKSRLALPQPVFNALVASLSQEKHLVDGQAWLALPEHQVRFTPQQEAQIEALMRQFAAAPASPPSVKTCRQALGNDLYQALLENGQLLQVSPDVVFRQEDYQALRQKIRRYLEENGQATAAEMRTLLGTSRKYALALLEYLDKEGLTRREGNFRKLR